MKLFFEEKLKQLQITFRDKRLSTNSSPSEISFESTNKICGKMFDDYTLVYSKFILDGIRIEIYFVMSLFTHTVGITIKLPMT